MDHRDDPVISADGHIDLPLLPHDLFDRFAPPHMRARMPRVVERDGGRYWVDEHGAQLALVGGSGNTGQAYVRGQSTRFDRMNESGFWDDCANGVYHPTDPALRTPPRTVTASWARSSTASSAWRTRSRTRPSRRP